MALMLIPLARTSIEPPQPGQESRRVRALRAGGSAGAVSLTLPAAADRLAPGSTAATSLRPPAGALNPSASNSTYSPT